MDWFPWYFIIYKQDTLHLDPYQDGCYRRLIDHYMETRSPLPDNDQALARIVGDSHPNWVAMASATVRPYFTPQNGMLYHKKCDEILNNQDKKAQRLSESGKKGAEKRHKKINDMARVAMATPKPRSSIGDIEEIEIDKVSKIVSKTDARLLPSVSAVEIDMAFQRIWNAYPGRGRDGAVGTGFKGSKKKALEKFSKIYITTKEEDREKIIGSIIDCAGAYAGHLDRSGYPSKHLATWINQRGWEDDYDSTKPQPTGGIGSINRFGGSAITGLEIALADQTRRSKRD